MPALDATTTAAFASANVDPNSLYALMQYVFGVGFSMGLWVIKAAVPFLFVIVAIMVLIGVAFAIFRWVRAH